MRTERPGLWHQKNPENTDCSQCLAKNGSSYDPTKVAEGKEKLKTHKRTLQEMKSERTIL